ncbi:MAG: hypothetical protein HOP18_24255 [Deltaproteobacteria bacterium]|nr:hypothetical protein [Deltaproteobacteria bacterium]
MLTSSTSASAPEPSCPITRLYIGGVFASRDAAEVQTTLGSCIAACLFDPVAGIGGMNHFLLPHSSSDAELPTRYGIHAMEVLINDMMKLGGDRRRFQAKVFGGARVLALFANGATVAEKNVQFVQRFLGTENIPVVAHRLGGTQPMRVHFFTRTGRALVKPLGTKQVHTIVEEETRFGLDIVKQLQQPHPDRVTLF